MSIRTIRSDTGQRLQFLRCFKSVSSEVFGICGTISCALVAQSFANWCCRPTEHRKLQICFPPKSKLRNMQIVTLLYMINCSNHISSITLRLNMTGKTPAVRSNKKREREERDKRKEIEVIEEDMIIER